MGWCATNCILKNLKEQQRRQRADTSLGMHTALRVQFRGTFCKYEAAFVFCVAKMNLHNTTARR